MSGRHRAGRLDPRCAGSWPVESVERAGRFRYVWAVRAGLGGRVIESGWTRFRWVAVRQATAAYRSAIGLRRSAAGRPGARAGRTSEQSGAYA